MTYNQNFYNQYTFHGGNFVPPTNFTFPPPPFQNQRKNITDEDIVKSFEDKIKHLPKYDRPTFSISQLCFQIRNIICLTNNLKEKEKFLQDNIDSLSDGEWDFNMEEIKTKKVLVEGLMMQISDTYLDTAKSALIKRASKRSRIKRLKCQKKTMKQENLRIWEERSREIDENLQKLQDDIDKAKMDEQSKLQADAILRDVLRKKHDAKKTLTKLEALVRLRRARENTAKGRGLAVPQGETDRFHGNIAKLKSLWQEKLTIYEREESDLRSQLEQDSKKQTCTSDSETKVEENLKLWQEFLFGGAMPQYHFGGDVGKFVNVRCRWDQYVNPEGTSLPVGWIVPVTS